MKAMTTKLSCEKLAQVVSINKVKGFWCVEQRDTKNLLGVKRNKIVFRCENYREALAQYISTVERQARHIALMSF